MSACYSVRFFFFQAEDGIRDGHVTGVQTCALPILGQAITVVATAGPVAVAVGAHQLGYRGAFGPRDIARRLAHATAAPREYLAAARRRARARRLPAFRRKDRHPARTAGTGRHRPVE